MRVNYKHQLHLQCISVLTTVIHYHGIRILSITTISDICFLKLFMTIPVTIGPNEYEEKGPDNLNSDHVQTLCLV
ncbi:hypothetical protein GCM10008902_11080 [[Clostridium] innocuum]